MKSRNLSLENVFTLVFGSEHHKSAAVEAGAVAENQALKLLAVDDDIMIEFQAFSVISAVVPTTTG